MKDMYPATAREITLIVNPGGGAMKRDPGLLDAVLEVLGPTTRQRWLGENDDIAEVARGEAAADGRILVPVGGDGTTTAVAGVAAQTGAVLGVLPMGTFNFFARGLGLGEDPVKAAGHLVSGRVADLPVGEVNGRLFLNNASVGVYSRILGTREEVYRRYGRNRFAAYWSVAKAFLRYRQSLRLTLSLSASEQTFDTPLLFVARSAYQMEHFGLDCVECIRAGYFALLAAPEGTRRDLFRQAFRLLRRNMQRGRDYAHYCTDAFEVDSPKKSLLVACDGEKHRMETPLRFRMRPTPLKVILPDPS